MRKPKWFLLLSAIVFVIGMSACGGGDGTENNDAGMNNGATGGSENTSGAAVDAAAAEAIYKANCVGCHAADLVGRSGPNLQKVGANLSLDEIKATITNGGGGMPAFKSRISEADIDVLSNWLASKK